MVSFRSMRSRFSKSAAPVPWDDCIESFPEWNEKERAQYVAMMLSEGDRCWEIPCVMGTNWIEPGAPWSLAHDGYVFMSDGPAHPECREAGARKRGVTWAGMESDDAFWDRVRAMGGDEPHPWPKARRRSKAKKPESSRPGPKAGPDEGAAGDLSVRLHHYAFAHHTLRELLAFPHSLTQLVDEDYLNEVVHSLWEEVGNKLGPNQQLASEGLVGRSVDVEGVLGALVVLPTALNGTEAHAALIVPLDPPNDRRFFTLEVFALDGNEHTVICEWEGQAHRNLGLGPAGFDHEGFIARVAQVLHNL